MSELDEIRLTVVLIIFIIIEFPVSTTIHLRRHQE